MDSTVFFGGWPSIWRTATTGVLSYIALICLLRLSGKRTLSKMNAFDLVVTVSLGSTLASILLSKSVSLLDGITALATLISLQFVVAWSSIHSAFVRRIVKSEPRLLVCRGKMLSGAMRQERITEDEVFAALRNHGRAGLESTNAVILETDGSLSVVDADSNTASAVLVALSGYPPSAEVSQ